MLDSARNALSLFMADDDSPLKLSANTTATLVVDFPPFQVGSWTMDQYYCLECNVDLCFSGWGSCQPTLGVETASKEMLCGEKGSATWHTSMTRVPLSIEVSDVSTRLYPKSWFCLDVHGSCWRWSRAFEVTFTRFNLKRTSEVGGKSGSTCGDVRHSHRSEQYRLAKVSGGHKEDWKEFLSGQRDQTAARIQECQVDAPLFHSETQLSGRSLSAWMSEITSFDGLQ